MRVNTHIVLVVQTEAKKPISPRWMILVPRQVASSSTPPDQPQANANHREQDGKTQKQSQRAEAQTASNDSGAFCRNPEPNKPQTQPLLLLHQASMGSPKPASNTLGLSIFRMTAHSIHLNDDRLFSTPVRGWVCGNNYHNFSRICVPPVSKNGKKWLTQRTQRKSSSMAKALPKKGKGHFRRAHFGGRYVPVVAPSQRDS